MKEGRYRGAHLIRSRTKTGGGEIGLTQDRRGRHVVRGGRQSSLVDHDAVVHKVGDVQIAETLIERSGPWIVPAGSCGRARHRVGDKIGLHESE